MKKLFTILALSLVVSSTFAQKTKSTKVEKETSRMSDDTSSPSFESSKGEEYMPKQGDWAIGFNVDRIFEYVGNAFNGNTNNNAPSVDFLKQGAFVGKYFKEDNKAYRVIVNLGYGTDKFTATNNTPGGVFPKRDEETKTRFSEFDFKIGLGKEWRRGKTRLQGFYGADAIIGYNSGRDQEVEVNISNTPSSGAATTSSNVKTTDDNGGIFSIGVNGFVGAEYFLFPKIAIGAQYNWGLGVAFKGASTRTVSTSTNPAASPAIPDVESETAAKNTAFYLGENKNLPTGGNATVGVGTASISLTLHF
jgi:hypothetical protein